MSSVEHHSPITAKNTNLIDSTYTNYGSFNPSITSSPPATVASVLDITTYSKDSMMESTESSPNSYHSPFIRQPDDMPSKASIKVIESYHPNILSQTNGRYTKQHHIKNASSSSLPSISSFSEFDRADLDHHIKRHGMSPLINGTPHHNEAHIKHIGQSPIRSVIFNMLNCIIGAGVVGLPFVFSTAGLFGGLLLMIFFAMISAYSLKLLIISAKLCQQKNYEDLCEYLFGFKGYLFVSLTMFIFDFGASLSYLIILGDAASQIGAIWGFDSTFDRRIIILTVSTLIILPTILPRDMSKIEKISTLSVASVILIMLIVVWEWIAYRFLMFQSSEGYISHIPSSMSWGVRFEGFPMAIGIIAFAFVCHDSSFLLYNTLKQPTIARWTTLSYSGCALAVFICACFAVPGYLTFGDAVSDNILTSYDTMNPLIIAARCVYCITMALTYPCSFFVARHVCYALFHHGPGYQSITKAPLWKHLLFTLPLFAANLLMGIFIESLGIVMSVCGSLSAVILAFVLPTMCYLKLCQYHVCFWKEKGMDRKLRALRITGPPALLWLFGVCIAIFSTSFIIAQKYGLRFD